MEVSHLCDTLQLIAEIMALCRDHPDLSRIACERLNEITARHSSTEQPSPPDEHGSSWKKTNAYREIRELLGRSKRRLPIGEFRELATKILSPYDDCKFTGTATKKMLYQKLNEHWAGVKEKMLRTLCDWEPS
jgi:hypothetical protein